MLNQKKTKILLGALAMLSAVYLWSAGASADMPLGIQGDVTVVNEDTARLLESMALKTQ